MTKLARMYSRIPPQDCDITCWWMSRFTIQQIAMAAPPSVASIHDITIFGMRVMIDDRMPYGRVTIETHRGTTDILNESRDG